MNSSQPIVPPSSELKSGWKIFLVCQLLAALVAIPLQAKENPVTAIALFDSPSGPAYAQITGLLVNGKSELRVCDGAPKFNKTGYDTLPRIQLAGAAFLERGDDGTLVLSVNPKPVCVVPNNLKFDRNAELTPAEAAEQAVLQGAVVSSSLQAGDLPQFKRGVKLVFVAAPDEELAQFLLAQRVNSVAGWQDFLQRNGSSAHTAAAKSALAGMHEQAAEAAFSRYQKSGDLGLLKQAEQQALQANKAVGGYLAANKLRARISKELDALNEADSAKLEAFRKAITEQTFGYAELLGAKKHNEELLSINPDYAPVFNLHNEIIGEVRKLDAAVANAEATANSKGYDDALQALGPYRAFAAEVPRIESLVAAAYSAHFTRGQELAGQQDWEKAVTEFRRASEIRTESKEARAALSNAESQLKAVRDRQAIEHALAESKGYADNKQFIEAYAVLAELSDGQRSLVTAQIQALKKDYVPAAAQRAQKLQSTHIPIRGRVDEDAIREAYDLLSHASELSGEPALRFRLDLLSDKIGAYYVDQAKRYLDKPAGSGVGIGWLYLGEAERYKPNLSTVKDAMAQYGSAYQLKSRLSVGVVLRDQTSRRDSLGFADQLTDAIATGLESSGLSIKVLRQPKEGGGEVQPNFLLIGEILEHRVVKDANLETLQSKYRAGTHEIKNETWTQASRDFEAAQQQLNAAQRTLADAQAQHKKKEIVAAANDAVMAAQKQFDDSKQKLESTPQTQVQSVVAPYNYVRKSIDLTATVELAFRITDSAGNVIGQPTRIPKANHKKVTVLENVKPEDTEGVKSVGTDPDEVQFLTDLEIQARDTLVKSVKEKVLVLPGKILQEARNRAGQGDVDGAGEEYVLYLNATANTGSDERAEATKFLQQHFNVGVAGATQLAASK